MPVARAARLLAGATTEQAAALWWDTARWPSFVEGFGHVSRREGDWPAAGARIVWDSRPGGRGRVQERIVARDEHGGADVEVEDERLRATRRVRFVPDPGARGAIATVEVEFTTKAPTVPLWDVLVVRRRLAAALDRTLARFERELRAEAELAGEARRASEH